MRGSIAGFALLLTCVCVAEEVAPPLVNLTVLDERPDDTKKQKILSLIVTNCNYGVYRLGEKKAPGRFDALRADLASIKGASLDGKTLHVARFDIFLNNSVWLRQSLDSQYSGALIEVLKKQGVNCPREKMQGGWYEASEITTPNAPIIVEMSATLDGIAHDVRAVHSPAISVGGKFTKENEATEYHAALRKVAEALAAQLP